MRKPVVFREQGGTHVPLACRHLSGCAQTQSQSPARPVAGGVPAGGWARPPPAAPCMPSCGAPPLSPLPPLAHTPMESCSAFPSSRSPAAARSWGLCPGARDEGALGEAGRRAGGRWPLGLAASSGGKPKKKREGEAPTRPRRRLPSPPPPLLSSISPPTHLPLSSRAGSFNYGGGNPMRPHRVRLTHSLVENYDLPKMLKVKKTMGERGVGGAERGGLRPAPAWWGAGGRAPPFFFLFLLTRAPTRLFPSPLMPVGPPPHTPHRDRTGRIPCRRLRLLPPARHPGRPGRVPGPDAALQPGPRRRGGLPRL